MAAPAMVLDAGRIGAQAARLERDLRQRIVGQDEAIEYVVRAYQTHLAGLNNPDRPVATFLFLGPTGSGKTRMVEALAESLAGDPRAVVKIDCAEYQHGHEIAKLIGSPPGYLGHRETQPLLSQDNLDQHHSEHCRLSFVLFDEIEKASPALWNLLLGILDKGRLTLGDNHVVDFSRALIFMTSNLGSAEMSALMAPGMGFTGSTPQNGAGLERKIAKAGADAARRKFMPEFMNRIDAAVVFRPLDHGHLRAILDLELGYVQQRLLASARGVRFRFECSDGVKDFLLREGTDARYGARHLKRAVERRLVQPLAGLITTEQVQAGEKVMIDVSPDTGSLLFTKQPVEEEARDSAGERKPDAPTLAPLIAAAAREARAARRRAS